MLLIGFEDYQYRQLSLPVIRYLLPTTNTLRNQMVLARSGKRYDLLKSVHHNVVVIIESYRHS
jgi:hypothetical protein